MRAVSGQAVVETAIVLPVMLVLVLGAVEVSRLADARAGLDAATMAAASAAARAPSAPAAQTAAAAAFQSAVVAYPLRSPTLSLRLGGFQRGGQVSATGNAAFDLGVTPMPGLPRTIRLSSSASALVAPWRSR